MALAGASWTLAAPELWVIVQRAIPDSERGDKRAHDGLISRSNDRWQHRMGSGRNPRQYPDLAISGRFRISRGCWSNAAFKKASVSR